MSKRMTSIMGTGQALRWRIVTVLLAAALLPLSLVGIGSWVVFSRLLEQKSLEHLRTVVHSHGRMIEADLEERLHLLRLAAATVDPDEMHDSDRLRKLLANLNYSSNTGFVDLGVIDSAGDHVGYVGPYNLRGLNYRQADWFSAVMASGAYVSDVFLGYRQVPHCIVAVKRTTAAGEPWILRATINSVQFDELVRTSELGGGSDIYILNRDGRYQTKPRSGDLLDQANGAPVAPHPGVKDERVVVDGLDWIKVTTWINDGRWSLVAQRELAAVQEPVNRAFADGALVVVLAIILLFVTAFFATWHLTDRIRKANVEREEMSRAFIRSAKLASIGELATGLAHEINNPLAIISAEQTNISDLLAELETNPQPRQIIESIERCKLQVQRCATITGKMLQFGRKRESQVKPTQVASRLLETVHLLERHAAVRNIVIRTEIEADLPPALLDPVELEQVLVNLINNSIDAMPNGGTITVTAVRDASTLAIQVIDDGSGIESHDLERIFEPFFTTKPVGQGTGLGLSVCHGIVQSWGGTLKARSAPGEGTVMEIRVRRDLLGNAGS